ncbi:resolvase [Clostridium sp. CAG:798]|nr:resolvase [Clostridium sp. CAG:798]
MGTLYGVARISTGKQNTARQIRNILKAYPDAIIVKETYTGTKLEGRKDFEHLIKILKEGDTLVFDSVSRMSRNSKEGCELYEELFNRNIILIFLKEPHINSEVYKQALQNQIKLDFNVGDKATDEFMNSIIEALNKLIIALARKQIEKAFEQAEKEVLDLHQKTSEGMLTAKLAGKQIGQKTGAKLTTKKSKKAKEQILKYCKDFDGSLTDVECIKLIGISRNTYYTYKKDLKINIF